VSKEFQSTNGPTIRVERAGEDVRIAIYRMSGPAAGLVHVFLSPETALALAGELARVASP
jgi:hypothetical protein